MSDETVIQTSDDGKLRVRVEVDAECESPVTSGDWWCVSVIYLDGGPRYYGRMTALHDPEGRLAKWEDLNDRRGDPDAAFIRYMRIFHNVKVEEVGVGSDFTRGLAWVERSELRRAGFDDVIAPAEDADPAAMIRSGLAEYNAWAQGDCYGYVVEEQQMWAKVDADGSMGDDLETRTTWEPVDSCGGFIGYDHAEGEARDALKSHTKEEGK